MILKLSEKTIINLLQVCYWQEIAPSSRQMAEVPDHPNIIEIVFPGKTSLILSLEETISFKQLLQQMAQPSRIQPAGGILVPQ